MSVSSTIGLDAPTAVLVPPPSLVAGGDNPLALLAAAWYVVDPPGLRALANGPPAASHTSLAAFAAALDRRHPLPEEVRLALAHFRRDPRPATATLAGVLCRLAGVRRCPDCQRFVTPSEAHRCDRRGGTFEGAARTLLDGDAIDNGALAALYGGIATSIAGKPRRVVFGPPGCGFATDLRGTIGVDPRPLPPDAPLRAQLAVILAGIYHELGHEEFTQLGHWASILALARSALPVTEPLDLRFAGLGAVQATLARGRRDLPGCYNVVEDGRIERELARHYHGIAEYLAAAGMLQPRWDELVGEQVPVRHQLEGALLYTALPYCAVTPALYAGLAPRARALFDELGPLVLAAARGDAADTYHAALYLAYRLQEEGLAGDELPAGIVRKGPLPAPPPGIDPRRPHLPAPSSGGGHPADQGQGDSRRQPDRQGRQSGRAGAPGRERSAGHDQATGSRRSAEPGQVAAPERPPGRGGTRAPGAQPASPPRPPQRSRGAHQAGGDSPRGDDQGASSGADRSDASSTAGEGDAHDRGERPPGATEGAGSAAAGAMAAAASGGDGGANGRPAATAGRGAAGTIAGADAGSGGEPGDDGPGDTAGIGDGPAERSGDAGAGAGAGAGAAPEAPLDEVPCWARGTGGGDVASPSADHADGGDGSGGVDGPATGREESDGKGGASSGSGAGRGHGQGHGGVTGSGAEPGPAARDPAADSPARADQHDHRTGSSLAAAPRREADEPLDAARLADVIGALERQATAALEGLVRVQTRPERLGALLHRPLGDRTGGTQRFRGGDGAILARDVQFPRLPEAEARRLLGRRTEHRRVAVRLATQLRAIRDLGDRRLRRQLAGLLDRRRLVPAVTGQRDVRTQTGQQPETSYAMSILADMSGSMVRHVTGGALFDGVMTLADTNDLLALPYEVRLFDDGITAQVKAIGDPVFDPLRAAALTRWGNGGTRMFDVASLALTALAGCPRANRVLVALSDGRLDDHGSVCGLLGHARRHGIATLGIYLGTCQDTAHLDQLYGVGNWAIIQSLAALPVEVGRRLAVIFRRQRPV